MTLFLDQDEVAKACIMLCESVHKGAKKAGRRNGHVVIPFKALYVKTPGMNISSVVSYLLVPYLVVSDSVRTDQAGCGHVKEFECQVNVCTCTQLSKTDIRKGLYRLWEGA